MGLPWTATGSDPLSRCGCAGLPEEFLAKDFTLACSVQPANLVLNFQQVWEERMTVLIVDDNPGVRRLLRRAVLDTASVVWECPDGADALAVYADRVPDVVLMDIRMPRMDGLTATRQICQSHPEARVVMITDYDDEDLRKAAAAAGARAYALKQNLTDLSGLIRLIAGEAE